MKNFIFIMSLCIGVLTNTTLHPMKHKKNVSQTLNLREYQTKFKFHNAVYAENINTVNDMLEKNANINEQDDLGCTPLFVAAYMGNLDIVNLLLQHGALHTANYSHESPYDIAVKSGHSIVAQILQEHWINSAHI